MLSTSEFIKQSLELNLFFGRIMKEHSFFLAAGLMQKNQQLIERANMLKDCFTQLLYQTVYISNGIIGKEYIETGDIITEFTLDAELKTEFYTGVNLNTNITVAEQRLVTNPYGVSNPYLEQQVSILNQMAINLTENIIQYKTLLLNNIYKCNIFALNYPLLIEHIRREAMLYLDLLNRLQHKQNIYTRDILEQEAFWNRIMAEHAKFIRGLLDPSEDELLQAANDTAEKFDDLTKAALESIDRTIPPKVITKESLEATESIRNFKAQGTKGILECKIKSIILPLLADHVLREANHYLKLLRIFSDEV